MALNANFFNIYIYMFPRLLPMTKIGLKCIRKGFVCLLGVAWSFCLHTSSAGCYEWEQYDRLAECAICGTDNSYALGNSGINIQIRPRQFRDFQSEEQILPLFSSSSISKQAIFQGFLGNLCNHLVTTISKPYVASQLGDGCLCTRL